MHQRHFGDPIPGKVEGLLHPNRRPTRLRHPAPPKERHLRVQRTATVAYGARGAFIYRTFTGGFPCTNTAFGSDPLAGVGKSCSPHPVAVAPASAPGELVTEAFDALVRSLMTGLRPV